MAPADRPYRVRPASADDLPAVLRILAENRAEWPDGTAPATGETLTVLDGEIQVTFRGETIVGRASRPSTCRPTRHMLSLTPERHPCGCCACARSRAGRVFTLVGRPVATRTEPPPPLDAEAQAAFIAKSMMLAPQCRTELLPPPSHG